MKASEVNPKNWNWDPNYPIRVLYDDEDYSLIWGKYKEKKALGARWSGDEERGYPGQGEYPTWYVEPDFISIAILQRLLTQAIDSDELKYVDNIYFAISELMSKIKS